MNALGMLMSSTLLMIPIVLLVDGPPDFDLSIGVWGALLSLAAASTGLAFVLYFAILERAGVANVSLVTLLIPPFTITLGSVFLEEKMVFTAWFGFAVIAVGFAVTDGRVFARFFRRL